MKKISKRAIKLWRITNSIVAGVFLLIALGLLLTYFFIDFMPLWPMYIPLSIALYIFIVHILITPTLKYRYFKYGVVNDELRIHQGILFKSKNHIPLFRIQNIDTHVGPIMRKMNLKRLSFKTAGTSIAVPELDEKEANELREYIRARINENIGQSI